ncbi:hypothetical protein [Microbacterium candidum]|uniref:Uncharacterized protein n=1 Tax=Microbacterium candidum TaxID=3041922 RepID=A0ABT7N1Z8_9MICO|nr:hypothetical protein [Microbacterium sp. ASV49]MDL9980735.1 hypothetical protein [Microbacterium sp. ASV49]
MATFTEAQLETASAQLDLLNTELDTALATQSSTSSAIDSRAGLLTGASAILGTVQVTATSSPWLSIALILTGLAIAVGLFVVWQRWDYALELPKVELMLLSRTPKEALYRLIQEKQWVLATRQGGVERRARWLFAGYVVLALSLVAWLVLSFIPGGIPK